MTTTVYTDDELEVMARKFEQDHWFDAAAMLRACKGRVRPLPRGDGEGGWTLPMELLAEIRDEVYANEWDAPCAEVIEIIALSTEARILAALDPVPDHAEWDAAIEAAAKVAQSYGCCHVPQEIAEEIRALKKGPTQ